MTPHQMFQQRMIYIDWLDLRETTRVVLQGNGGYDSYESARLKEVLDFITDDRFDYLINHEAMAEFKAIADNLQDFATLFKITIQDALNLYIPKEWTERMDECWRRII